MEKLLLKPGDEVGSYVLEREIASGGTGCVFAARHQVFGHTRALKIMHLRESLKEDAMARWQREAILLSTIRHGNIVRVHDAGVSSHGLFWIAMDLLQGETLRERLNKTPRIPISLALHFGTEIADGVQAAHEMDVVHRDVKPENVFVTEADEIKVLDLGTAKVHGYGIQSTDHFKVRGTLLYMAPEQCEAHPVDARTDVYALGLVLYEMMAGWHPFMRPGSPIPTPQELVSRQLVLDPEPLPIAVPGFPEYIWQVVQRALQKEPKDRFGSMLELSIALREVRGRALSAAARHAQRAAGPAEEPSVPDGTVRKRQSTAPLLAVAGAADVGPLGAPKFALPASVSDTVEDFPPGMYTARGTFRMPTAKRDDLKAALEAAARVGAPRPSEAPPAAGGAPPGASPGALRGAWVPVAVGPASGAPSTAAFGGGVVSGAAPGLYQAAPNAHHVSPNVHHASAHQPHAYQAPPSAHQVPPSAHQASAHQPNAYPVPPGALQGAPAGPSAPAAAPSGQGGPAAPNMAYQPVQAQQGPGAMPAAAPPRTPLTVAPLSKSQAASGQSSWAPLWHGALRGAMVGFLLVGVWWVVDQVMQVSSTDDSSSSASAASGLPASASAAAAGSGSVAPVASAPALLAGAEDELSEEELNAVVEDVNRQIQAGQLPDPNKDARSAGPLGSAPAATASSARSPSAGPSSAAGAGGPTP